MKMTPNQGLEGSAEQRRYSVPTALRAAAPPQPHRWTSESGERMGNADKSRGVSAVRIATLVTAAMLVLIAGERAFAAEYPAKTITIIVPFPPGGATDAQARLVAKGLSDRLGKPVVVDNRPGAGGRLGCRLAARAAPDGHTLLFGTNSALVIEPLVHSDVGYDPQRDFAPITLTTEVSYVLVVPSTSRAKDVAGLLAEARGLSGAMTYGSWGMGSTGHLLGEMLRMAAHIDIVHVPYKGEGPALIDLIGGQVSMMFGSSPSAAPHIQAGKLRALAVVRSSRLTTLPNVPTMAEVGIAGFDITGWLGLLVPARTPPDIVARLHREITSILKAPEFTDWAKRQEAVVVASTPAAFAQRMKTDSTMIAKLVSTINMKVD